MNDDEQMREIRLRCGEPRREAGLCFRLVHPVTFIMPDGSTIDCDSREEADAAMRNWREANPESEARPVLQLPVDVELADGTVVTVDGDEQMRGIKERCRQRQRNGIQAGI